MPRLATCSGLGDRWLSWSQTSAICRAARKVPVRCRGELDRRVDGAMVAHRDGEPDAIVQDVWDWVDHHQPTPPAPARPRTPLSSAVRCGHGGNPAGYREKP